MATLTSWMSWLNSMAAPSVMLRRWGMSHMVWPVIIDSVMWVAYADHLRRVHTWCALGCASSGSESDAHSMRIDPVHTGFWNSRPMRIVRANCYATSSCGKMAYVNARSLCLPFFCCLTTMRCAWSTNEIEEYFVRPDRRAESNSHLPCHA